MEGAILTFLAISAVVIITPGQDTALTVRNTIAGGRQGGIATAFGVACGQMVWALATDVGVITILTASETIFTTIKLLGAAYLVFLGLQALHRAFAGSDASGPENQREQKTLSSHTGFIQGLISNLCNPKMAAFFASLLPQFISPGPSAFGVTILLGLTFCTMTFFWLAGYAAAITKAGHVLRWPKVARTLEGITGFTILALGIRVATSQNSSL